MGTKDLSHPESYGPGSAHASRHVAYKVGVFVELAAGIITDWGVVIAS